MRNRTLALLVVAIAGCAQVNAPARLYSAKKSTLPNSVTTTTLTLAWNSNPPSDNVTSYNVYEKFWDGKQIFPRRKKASVTQPTYTDSARWGIHIYSVSAVNNLGVESAQSRSVTVSTQ